MNAIVDVFGIDAQELEITVEAALPRDEVSLGFDNQADTIGLTDLHVDGYLKIAESVASTLVAEPHRIAELAQCSPESADCARQLVRTLAQRLQRRMPREAELERLLSLFGSDFATAGFTEGSARVVTALLQSPSVLYRELADETDPSRNVASPAALATRLALLFWGSVPDAALLTAAENGALATSRDVEREARRLAADPRARRGVAHFYEQWLSLSEFSQVEKDSSLFRVWSEPLRRDMQRETERFIEAVLWEDDARLETLLTAPYTFANARLADLYGLPIDDPDQTELQRVDFAAGTPRLGILTQASILSARAKADQTSPITRGKFIREQFFCTIPPPPPPNIAVSPPPLDPRRTTRQRFEAHRTDPSCASCHVKLDPVGLAFEHYDAIGRYRDDEAGVPIDATGYLIDTDVDGDIDGAASLAERLAQSREVRECMVTQWFRYAFGRPSSEADVCTLERLDEVFERSGGDLSELLVALTQTEPFLRPRSAPESATPGEEGAL